MYEIHSVLINVGDLMSDSVECMVSDRLYVCFQIDCMCGFRYIVCMVSDRLYEWSFQYGYRLIVCMVSDIDFR